MQGGCGAKACHDSSVNVERFDFVGSGGARLAGLLRAPEDEVRGSAVLAHCFTCGKDVHTTTRLAKALTEAGWLTLTFDSTGLGESGGDFAETTVGTEVGDITRAAVALIERNAGPCLLIGHSLGGAAAVLAASRLKTVSRLICIAAPSSVGHVSHLLTDGERGDDGSIDVDIGGRPFRIGDGFLADLANHDVLDAAQNLTIPVLVVEAGDDDVVEQSQTRRLAAAANAEVVTIAGADHLFGGAHAAGDLATEVVRWLEST